MKRHSLQVTLFAKILLLNSILIFLVIGVFYINTRDTFIPFVSSKDVFTSFFYGTYLIMSIVMIMAVITSYILSLNITKRLSLLTKLVSYIGAGQFEIKASHSITGTDEIAELAFHFDQMAIELRQRNRLKSILQKLHGKVLTDQFINGALEKKASELTVAVLFLDIRGFTHLTEKKAPSIVIHLLNEFFDNMETIIKEHDGIIDKFMGDGLMAIWGIPESLGPQDAHNAFQCALKMQEKLPTLSLNLDIGIGIDYGRAILGQVGSKNQLDYTIIGNVVNTAFRIQKITKQYKKNLMISKNLAQQLPHKQQNQLESIEDILLPGKEKALTLYFPK